MQHGGHFRTVVMISALALGATVLSSHVAVAQRDVGKPPFQVEWQVQSMAGNAVIKGSVLNHTSVRVTDVRLRVEALDGNGAVLGESFGWVLGDVPAAGTAYFVVPLAVTGAEYRVSIVSFDEVSRDSDGASASP